MRGTWEGLSDWRLCADHAGDRAFEAGPVLTATLGSRARPLGQRQRPGAPFIARVPCATAWPAFLELPDEAGCTPVLYQILDTN